MIGIIALSIWLLPIVIIFPVVTIAMMIDERDLFPFDEWYHPLILLGLASIWPIVAGIVLYEEYTDRQLKLAEIQKGIEINYRDKWWD